MPTKPTTNMDNGKHWTKAERAARLSASTEQERDTRTYLRAPAWLSEDAREIWDETVRRLRGIELLDNLDAGMLAIYCDAMAKYQNNANDPEVDMKLLQGWSRIAAMYAEKLGLTPSGRARLAKKKAEKPVDEFAKEFGG